jgi:hypothetical protein
MKKSILGTLVISVFISLLVFDGCDTPVGDDEYWLAGVANPLIGTWETRSTAMNGTVTITEREFKTDGTIAVTTTGGNTSSSTSYYLIKDKFFVVSSTSSPYYTKYFFEVIDNNTLRIIEDGRSATNYTRVGDENPNVDRTMNLNNDLDGYWRWSLDHGTTEANSFMYDWWTINTGGTYHVYHYMSKNKHYRDRGEFSYYFDSDNKRLVTLSNGYTVTVYATSNVDLANGEFTLTPTGGSVRNYEKFDGSSFWESGHTKWE